MIEYDRRDWSSHLFDIHGSLVPEIAPRVMLAGVWAALVEIFCDGLRYYQAAHPGEGIWKPEWFHIPLSVHSLVGFAIGLLLVFRTNSSYDRFWEGRKLWGGMVNETRNLARGVCVHLPRQPGLRNELVRWTIAFPYAAMYKLRGQRGIEPVGVRLPTADVQSVLQAEHIPLEISRRLTQLLARGMEQGLVSDVIFASLDQNIQLLVDYLGGCERIHKTPLPYAYMVHLRRVVILYIAALPLALEAEWHWATIPATLLVAFLFFGIEEIGIEIEDPFEGDANDIPLESICLTIDRNLSALIGDEDPQPAEGAILAAPASRR